MISELLKESFIELNLEANTKNDAISHLSEMLYKNGKVSSHKDFYNAVLERERLGSTAIGAGIAIPHARTNVVNEVAVAFARSSKGIDFNSLDGDPVHLIFLLAAPIESGSLYLKLLARISRLLRYQDLIEDLKKAQTKEDIIRIISAKE